MGLSGINRVSSNMQALAMLNQLQRNTVRLAYDQQRLASGKQLLSVSDNPLAAEKISRLNQSLQRQDQILQNLRHADNYLTAADSALVDVSDLLTQAARIASEQAGSLQSTEERASQVAVVDGLIDQLLNIGNRQYQGDYLFGGRQSRLAPLATSSGRVTLQGDVAGRRTLVGEDLALPFSIPLADIYGLNSEVSGGFVDFDVQLDPAGRINELGGFANAGVRLGVLRVTETGPNITFDVDFTGVETINDLIARFNDAAVNAGATLSLGVSPADGGALRITSGGGNGITVADIGNGTTAFDLGLRGTVGAGTPLDGGNLNRRVTITTRLADLQPGGLALPDGVVITSGSKTVNVSFAGATRVQDVLNALNSAGAGVRASITEDGRSIQIENLIAGTPLIIGENGAGTDAEALGIKTIDRGVSLSRVNNQRGIHPVSGNDLRITNANGVSFEVDLTGANTIGDVIDAINAASVLAGAGVTASTSQGGAGLRLAGPAGPNNLMVEALNLSPVAAELGILKSGTPTALEGENVAPFRQPGIFSALYRLRDALLADSSSEITEAGSQINALQRDVATVQGQVGAASKAMRDRLQQTDDAVAATRILLSELEDIDYTEAVTRFQQAQTALQASLLSSSRISNLSLLDFLQ